MFSDIRFLIRNNVWISVGLLVAGIIILKFSGSSDLINLILWLMPSVSSNFVGNSLTITGFVLLGISFYTFAVWIKAANEKRNAQRENAMRHIA